MRNGTSPLPRECPSGLRRHGPPGVVAVLLVGLLVGLAMLVPGVALAQEDDEESGNASELVQQAVALIANRADAELVIEKIDDALEASEPAGVDLSRVEQARAVATATPDPAGLAQARELLVDAVPPPPPPAPMATGLATGTTEVLDEYVPAWGISDRGDAVLLGFGLAAVAVGLYLARRLRPAHSLRQLRRPAATTAPPAAGDGARADTKGPTR